MILMKNIRPLLKYVEVTDVAENTFYIHFQWLGKKQKRYKSSLTPAVQEI